MEVIPYCDEDKRTVYEMIAEGWHPLDVAVAYGRLVVGRPLASILDSPLVNQRYRPTTPRLLAVPKRHSAEKHYSLKDKEDAVWLVDNGWSITDVGVMVGMELVVSSDGQGWVNYIHSIINRWREVVHKEYE